MSDIDDVVARVRFALEHPNDDVVTVGDVTSLLAAYESAVRERDEARSVWERQARQYNEERYAAVLERDRASAALQRVRDSIENMDTHVAADDRSLFVWYDDLRALLDREAPDGE